MISPDDSRLSLILTIERAALAVRYLIVIGVGTLFFLGHLQVSPWGFGPVALILLGHNLFCHWVFSTQRYDLLAGLGNFFVYYFEVSLIVGAVWGDSNEVYALYYVLIVGFSVYSPQFRKTMLVAAACCLSFAGTILVDWSRGGIGEAWGMLAAEFLGILACGWLAGSLSDRLRKSEDDSFAQAQALASSESTLRTILDSAADPIVVYDDREFITEANDRACKFLGAPRELLLGQRIRAFLFDDGTWAAKMADLRARGRYRGEQIVVNAQGEERTVEIVVRSFLRDQERHFVAIARDTTEQKNLEEATRLANVNLERLNRELGQVNELRARFLEAISQKLRSPLTAVLGYLEMLVNEELGEVNPEQRKALRTCHRGALRVFQLVKEDLDMGGRQTSSLAGRKGEEDPFSKGERADGRPS